MARTLLLLAVTYAACLLAADARKLFAPAGTVEVKTQKVYDDPDGGVKPFEERYAAAKALAEPTLKLLKVEAECRKAHDEECKKLQELKEELEEEKEEEEEKEKITAPCKTSVWVNYFLGTTCLPDKPIDVKPKPKKEDDKKKKDRRF